MKFIFIFLMIFFFNIDCSQEHLALEECRKQLSEFIAPLPEDPTLLPENRPHNLRARVAGSKDSACFLDHTNFDAFIKSSSTFDKEFNKIRSLVINKHDSLSIIINRMSDKVDRGLLFNIDQGTEEVLNIIEDLIIVRDNFSDINSALIAKNELMEIAIKNYKEKKRYDFLENVADIEHLCSFIVKSKSDIEAVKFAREEHDFSSDCKRIHLDKKPKERESILSSVENRIRRLWQRFAF